MGWLASLLGRGDQRRAGRHVAPAGPTPGGLSGGYAVVDVETTGLSPRHDRVVSIGVVLLDPHGAVQHEWGTLVDPEGPVGATHIHGIRDQDVIGAPTFDQLVADLINMFRGRAIAGHNISFDQGFLRYEFGRAGWSWPSVPTLCTMRESMYFLPQLDRRRLADCCWAAGIPLDHAHSAIDDARATAALLSHYLDPHVGLPPLPAHRTIVSLATSTTWPNRPGSGPVAAPETAPRVLTARALHVIAHRPPPLGSLLERFTVTDALDEGASQGDLSYIETLVEVVEDGQVTTEERTTLAEVAELYDLADSDTAAAHRGFVRALSREALEDGHLSRAEKREILHIAGLLDVPASDVSDLLEGEETRRLTLLSQQLAPLPDDWPLGEPLRVGDRIAFTGCEDFGRDALEARAAAAGLRVLGNVSRRTVLLVADGSFAGTKAHAAASLGTRVVHPDDFQTLLAYIQPWREPEAHPPAARAPAAPATRVRASGAAAASSRPTTPAPRVASPAVVRTWALQGGLEVGVRGRLSAEVWAAYAAAHPDLTPDPDAVE